MALRIPTDEDESTIGWVSMTDIFLLTTVLMVVMTIFVQVRFDRYRDRAAITQEQVAALHQQITRLKGENEPLQLEMKKLEALEAQIAEFETQANLAGEEIAGLHQQIELLKQNKEILQARAQEAEEFKRRLADSKVSAALLEQKLANTQTQAADLENQLQEKEQLVQQLQDRLVETPEESMLRTPLSARLIVKVWAYLPKDYDIDLFVQDPRNRICFYRNPNIFEADVEVATMLLSEYLKKRPSGYTEEAYYSDRFILSENAAEDSYLVFAIIRNERTGEAQRLEQPIQLHYEVSVRDDTGRLAVGRSQRGAVRINLAGWSQVGGEGRLRTLSSLLDENGPDFKFLNLYALFGFYSTGSGRLSMIQRGGAGLPSVPREFLIVDSDSVQGSGDRRLFD
jgi:hypothetical protein